MASTTTTIPLDALRAMHEEALSAEERRRTARWRSALQVLGLVLLLTAIVS
jgi:hypothetical protein